MKKIQAFSETGGLYMQSLVDSAYITLVKNENSETGLLYDYYYLNGNQDEKINISSDDELDSLLGKYADEPLDYFDITEYVESLEK